MSLITGYYLIPRGYRSPEHPGATRAWRVARR
jgi:hypothetical protein